MSEPGRVAPERDCQTTFMPLQPGRHGPALIEFSKTRLLKDYALRSLPTTSEPLWPPKPKLLDMAMEMSRFRAVLGV